MAALSAGHGATDFANGALPALLPFMVDRFRLSYTLAAVVMLASTASSSLVQPLFGAWSDRRGALWLLPAGVALAGVGIALAAASPSYWLVLLLVVVSGLGVAAYHPEGSKFAAYASGAKRASGMSLFSVGGNIGYALGPTATTPLDPGARPDRRPAARAAGARGRAGAAARAALPVELRPRARHRRRRERGGPAGRARAAARRDRLPQRRLVRADHLRAALGGLARPLEGARLAPALADAARRRARHAGRGAAGRPARAPAGADREPAPRPRR